ncbi:hypothetical protein C8255_16740 [filamentous cyanobacterium CCP3]|nr:hypothetical protein C8255_16740 [filamentous cyanobacterium CCP3]
MVNPIPLQRQASDNSDISEIPPIVYEVLNSPGQPLDPETREFAEFRFNSDFGSIRIHTDTRAAKSAEAVNALAYTVGQRIVFGAGQYNPTTIAGKKLLGHELFHTKQQQGLTRPSTNKITLENSSGYEQQADNAAQAFLQDQAIPLVIGQPNNIGLQRQVASGSRTQRSARHRRADGQRGGDRIPQSFRRLERRHPEIARSIRSINSATYDMVRAYRSAYYGRGVSELRETTERFFANAVVLWINYIEESIQQDAIDAEHLSEWVRLTQNVLNSIEPLLPRLIDRTASESLIATRINLSRRVQRLSETEFIESGRREVGERRSPERRVGPEARPVTRESETESLFRRVYEELRSYVRDHWSAIQRHEANDLVARTQVIEILRRFFVTDQEKLAEFFQYLHGINPELLNLVLFNGQTARAFAGERPVIPSLTRVIGSILEGIVAGDLRDIYHTPSSEAPSELEPLDEFGATSADEEASAERVSSEGGVLVGAIGVGLIPIVGQVADVRDLGANLYLLYTRPAEQERWQRWLALAGSLLGLLPLIGDGLKYASRTIMSSRRGFRVVARFDNFIRRLGGGIIELVRETWQSRVVEPFLRQWERVRPYIENFAEAVLRVRSNVIARIRSTAQRMFPELLEQLRTRLDEIITTISEGAQATGKFAVESAQAIGRFATRRFADFQLLTSRVRSLFGRISPTQRMLRAFAEVEEAETVARRLLEDGGEASVRLAQEVLAEAEAKIDEIIREAALISRGGESVIPEASRALRAAETPNSSRTVSIADDSPTQEVADVSPTTGIEVNTPTSRSTMPERDLPDSPHHTDEPEVRLRESHSLTDAELETSVASSSHREVITPQEAANEVEYVNRHPELVEGTSPHQHARVSDEHEILQTPIGCERRSHPIGVPCPDLFDTELDAAFAPTFAGGETEAVPEVSVPRSPDEMLRDVLHQRSFTSASPTPEQIREVQGEFRTWAEQQGIDLQVISRREYEHHLRTFQQERPDLFSGSRHPDLEQAQSVYVSPDELHPSAHVASNLPEGVAEVPGPRTPPVVLYPDRRPLETHAVGDIIAPGGEEVIAHGRGAYLGSNNPHIPTEVSVDAASSARESASAARESASAARERASVAIERGDRVEVVEMFEDQARAFEHDAEALEDHARQLESLDAQIRGDEGTRVGPIQINNHAEHQMIADLERHVANLPPSRIRGGTLRVVVTQTPCIQDGHQCNLLLREFARQHGLNLEVWVPFDPSRLGTGPQGVSRTWTRYGIAVEGAGRGDVTVRSAIDVVADP